MSEIRTVDLRRPDGTVLVSWKIPLDGSCVYWCPHPGMAPRGMLELWCDHGSGFNQFDRSFVFTGDLTIWPPQTPPKHCAIRMQP